MKEFAHPDQKEMTAVDLNRAVQNTIAISRNEYKLVADVETQLEDLPPVLCHAGEVNQVVLNIIVNAAHAIEDVVKGTDRRGRITVRTHRDVGDVVISIGDTGAGIGSAIRDRIFDPFFTTKAVGRGSGQGLAIARSVIVDKHRGQLTFETVTGQGTTFHIRIPLASASENPEQALAL
jgi:signal transduction histidine kinase